MQKRDLSTLLTRLFNEKNYKKLEEKLVAELEIYNSYDKQEYKDDILSDIPGRVRNSKEFWEGVTNKDILIFASKQIQNELK